MNIRAIRKSKLVGTVLIFIMLLAFTSCGGSVGEKTLDVIGSIDYASITQDGEFTNFNVIGDTGNIIRFQGKNVTVNEGGILMNPGSFLCSLDYLGAISGFEASTDGPSAILDYGAAYADAPSVDHMQDLQAAICYGIDIGKNSMGNMDLEHSGFFVAQIQRDSQNPIHITALKIIYKDAQQVLYSDLDPDGRPVEFLAIYPTDWTGEGIYNDSVNVDVVESFGEEGKVFDLLAGIDENSVVFDETFTYFNAIGPEGESIRFQGIGVTVEKNKLQMQPGAKLFALDYFGRISQIKITSKREGDEVFFGIAYSNAPEVGSMTQLKAFPGLFPCLRDRKTEVVTYDWCETAYFVMNASEYQTEPIELDELLICYDPFAEQVFYSELADDSPEMEMLQNGQMVWEESNSLTYGAREEVLLLAKLEEPDTVISDIIAGIDPASVVVDGNITFFDSVMSDGSRIRFEGKNVSVTDGGLKFGSNSILTSLDALGKIYGYSAQLEDYGDMEVFLDYGYGYTYSADILSVERASDVHTYGISGLGAHECDSGIWGPTVAFEPNFVFVSGNPNYEYEFVISSLKVGYNPKEKVTAMVDVGFLYDFTTVYLEGDKYNAEKEGLADAESGNYDFYLCLKPDTPLGNLENSRQSVWFVPSKFYTVGDLKDAGGNVLDKKNAKLEEGTTLDITVGDYALTLELEVLQQYRGAQTMHDLVPYAYPEAVGDKNVLVVPVAWADQKENANGDTYAFYREYIGRVKDESGKVTDYSDFTDEEYSFSEYFDLASYGKMTITSFMTDWYYSDKTFSDMENRSPGKEYVDEVLAWVKERYPDLDWTEFDQDANGYVDSIILINAGVSGADSYMTISYGGAIHYRESYYGDYAGTPEEPNAHTFVTINDSVLRREGSRVLVHEFSHNLGLIDYYDVTYRGIDAVGQFDMQSSNQGDWNAYSKLAVGWMDPQVVTGLESGESVELTIGSLALTDDVIIIPAAGTEYEGPFSEYIMIDLLTDDGVNQYDTRDVFESLKNMEGVRISHVNATMEKRTRTVLPKSMWWENAKTYDIGTIHYANSYSDDGYGRYNVEVIQAGGTNTFTKVNSYDVTLAKDDLFYAGDVFTVEKYSEFFYEGRMDDGSKFGYKVSVVSIGKDAEGNPTATIRVTAQ